MLLRSKVLPPPSLFSRDSGFISHQSHVSRDTDRVKVKPTGLPDVDRWHSPLQIAHSVSYAYAFDDLKDLLSSVTQSVFLSPGLVGLTTILIYTKVPLPNLAKDESLFKLRAMAVEGHAKTLIPIPDYQELLIGSDITEVMEDASYLDRCIRSGLVDSDTSEILVRGVLAVGKQRVKRTSSLLRSVLGASAPMTKQALLMVMDSISLAPQESESRQELLSILSTLTFTAVDVYQYRVKSKKGTPYNLPRRFTVPHLGSFFFRSIQPWQPLPGQVDYPIHPTSLTEEHLLLFIDQSRKLNSFYVSGVEIRVDDPTHDPTPTRYMYLPKLPRVRQTGSSK